MDLLLDTHALILWFEDSDQLPAAVRLVIAHPENAVFVSAVNAWEIFTKYRLGKLSQMEALVADFFGHMERAMFLGLPISLRHAARAGALEGAHKDPFDRMLIAQALEDDLTLVSNEAAFDKFGVKRLW